MSIKLIDMAWESKLPTGRKFVLVALCDNASDEGLAYPSVQTIARKCGMGERTVQSHLNELETGGLISRRVRAGTSTLYYVHASKFPKLAPRPPRAARNAGPDTPADFAPPQNSHPRETRTPAESAPPQISHPAPAESAPPPPQVLQNTPADFAPRTVSEPSIEPSVNRQDARGARLPADWTLTKLLGEWALSEQPTWTPDHVRKVADQFRDYWHSKPGAAGRKTDWALTWKVWVRNEGALKPGQAGAAAGSMNKQEALEARNRAVAAELAAGVA